MEYVLSRQLEVRTYVEYQHPEVPTLEIYDSMKNISDYAEKNKQIIDVTTINSRELL